MSFVLRCYNFVVNGPGNGEQINSGAMSNSRKISRRNKLNCPTSISRVHVEKIEGGLMVAGVAIAANCRIILPIFGFLFLLIGCVLTAASYRGPGEDEGPDHYAARIALTGNSRILGPACIVIGFFMFLGGVTLNLLAKRARNREQTIGFHCPLHGDFYPLNPITNSKPLVVNNKSPNNSQWLLCWNRTRGPRTVAVGPPQCPHSQVSSTRSSVVSQNAQSQCPTPLPFLIMSGSVSGILPPTAQMSPDQPFGSIHSLSGGREVASFPLSRSPTPPFVTSESQNLVEVFDQTSREDCAESHHKSVSILLPSDDKG